ncbi:MAG: response regulator transcription factor [Thermodesulfobacteriota bacterium]
MKNGQLEERLKELDCLYSISQLTEEHGISLSELLHATTHIVARAWQYPDITNARISLEGEVFCTQDYKETPWKQATTIKVNHRNIGTLEVSYSERRPERDEGPFLKEERKLLNAIAERLGHIIEHKWAEQELERRDKELEDKNKSLEELNIALKVLLGQREEDKVILEQRILLNMQELILPYLKKLKDSGLDEKQKIFADILEARINDIISPFLHSLTVVYKNLSPKEIQVADLVKQGKTTKEIAELLNASPRAVEFHRHNLRKKLGLRNEKANLRSHLLSLI